MDIYVLRFAYCYRNRLLISLYWPETEMCSIRDDGELIIQNNAQRQSPRPMSNEWHYFRPTYLPTTYEQRSANCIGAMKKRYWRHVASSA